MRGATYSFEEFNKASVAFQSTLPMRGATPCSFPFLPSAPISIHAPHAGSDWQGFQEYSSMPDFNPRSPCGERQIFPSGNAHPGDFNPRSPCGERPLLERRGAVLQLFQSTLPMRGATFVVSDLFFYVLISIHAPHAGSDSKRS